ncbi:endodeoxyribonuclease [Salmonella enterica subsp. enterica]|nr:endodeoxyribonuclease [Salmonella enterica subsp. enterica serovar Enteritidis]
MLSETLKDIFGYEGQYAITTDGRIYSHSRLNRAGRLIKGRWMKPAKDKDGYLKVCLCSESGRSYQFVHRLVAAAFISNHEGYREVNHINGKKDDNRIDNLEWANRSQNNAHAYISGLRKPLRGSKHPNAKLTSEQVIDILTCKSMPHRKLALKHGVSQVLVSRIIRKEAWLHISI